MKRSWMGAALLLLLLLGGILATRAMGRIHEPIAGDLTAAGESALAGDWEAAITLSRRAGHSWKNTEVLRSCFSDHAPMEEIDADLAVLEVYRDIRDSEAFAALCAATAEKITALGQAQKLLVHNFL